MGRSWGAPEPGRQGLEIADQGPGCTPDFLQQGHALPAALPHTHTHTHCMPAALPRSHTHTLCMPANYAVSELCKCLPLRHSARVREGPATFLGPWASPWLEGGTRFD